MSKENDQLSMAFDDFIGSIANARPEGGYPANKTTHTHLIAMLGHRFSRRIKAVLDWLT